MAYLIFEALAQLIVAVLVVGTVRHLAELSITDSQARATGVGKEELYYAGRAIYAIMVAVGKFSSDLIISFGYVLGIDAMTKILGVGVYLWIVAYSFYCQLKEEVSPTVNVA